MKVIEVISSLSTSPSTKYKVSDRTSADCGCPLYFFSIFFPVIVSSCGVKVTETSFVTAQPFTSDTVTSYLPNSKPVIVKLRSKSEILLSSIGLPPTIAAVTVKGPTPPAKLPEILPKEFSSSHDTSVATFSITRALGALTLKVRFWEAHFPVAVATTCIGEPIETISPTLTSCVTTNSHSSVTYFFTESVKSGTENSQFPFETAITSGL